MIVNSSLDELNQAIKDCNPFESHFIVKSQHVWDEEFPDVSSLHAHASNAILNMVERINSGNLRSKTTSFAILAPKGVGKTHLLSRVRRQLKNKGNGFFIYTCEYGNLGSIKYQFLQAVASSLKKIGGKGVMQWQELATALISEVTGRNCVPQQLIEQFPKALAKKPQFIDQLVSKILEKCPDTDNPFIVRAIIWTLSSIHSPFAITWLAGRELSESQASLMGLPNPSKEDRDAEAFKSACQILNLIGYYTTPVVCFDELDGAESGEEEDFTTAGFTRAMVVASLAKDLYNNLNRGVLVTTAYEKTWKGEIAVLAGADAVVDRIAHEKIELRFLKPDDVVSLVSCWLKLFYSERNLTPPYNVYPFEEKQLRELGEERQTVREVLQWCAKNFGRGVNPIEKLERIYQQIEAGLEDFLDDNAKIANAIAFGLQRLKGQTVEGLIIKELNREVKPKSRHYGYINFKILGEENGKNVAIGVCVLQNPKGATVGAAIGYLTQYSTFKLTRGCLVRSKQIQSKWQVANKNLDKLLKDLSGEWVSFEEKQIRELITLQAMSKSLDENDFSHEYFQQFIDEKHPIANNQLIREILSDPSGQAPKEVLDEDGELEKLSGLGGSTIAEGNELSEELDLLAVA